MSNSLDNISHENLLDNPFFTINQRGTTTGTPSTITRVVDRWTMDIDFGTYTVSNDGLALNAASHTITIYQGCEIERAKSLCDGNAYTLSLDMTVRSKGSVGISIGYNIDDSWVDSSNPTNKYFPSDDIPIGRSIVSATLRKTKSTFSSNVGYMCWLFIEQGWDVTIHSIKMEKGELSTLSMDTKPNYATELLKCQRYFIRHGNPSIVNTIGVGQANSATTCMIVISLPVTLRTDVNPTITVNDYSKIQLRNGGVYKSATNVTSDARGVGVQNIMVESTGLTTGACYDCFIKSGGTLDISAEL